MKNASNTNECPSSKSCDTPNQNINLDHPEISFDKKIEYFDDLLNDLEKYINQCKVMEYILMLKKKGQDEKKELLSLQKEFNSLFVSPD